MRWLRIRVRTSLILVVIAAFATQAGIALARRSAEYRRFAEIYEGLETDEVAEVADLKSTIAAYESQVGDLPETVGDKLQSCRSRLEAAERLLLRYQRGKAKYGRAARYPFLSFAFSFAPNPE